MKSLKTKVVFCSKSADDPKGLVLIGSDHLSEVPQHVFRPHVQHKHVSRVSSCSCVCTFFCTFICILTVLLLCAGFQAAATQLSLGASIGLWLEFKSRWGLVNPSGPLCCRNPPRRTNQSPAGAVAPPSVALLASGNQNYESVRGRQRTTIMRLAHIPANAS